MLVTFLLLLHGGLLVGPALLDAELLHVVGALLGRAHEPARVRQRRHEICRHAHPHYTLRPL